MLGGSTGDSVGDLPVQPHRLPTSCISARDGIPRRRCLVVCFVGCRVERDFQFERLTEDLRQAVARTWRG
jgi:hypothetical protein